MIAYLHKRRYGKVYRGLSSIIICAMVVLSLSGCGKEKNVEKNPSVETGNTITEITSGDSDSKVEVEVEAGEELVSIPTVVKPPAIQQLSQGPAEVALATKDSVASIYIDSAAADYKGLALIAASFSEDMELVTGRKAEVITDATALKGTVIIAGSIGNNEIIDRMIADKTIDVASIQDKWETYQIQVLDKPIEGVDQAIVIVGSDKRGTMYGIYHISELIGVSPWVYWGDVLPVQREELTYSKDEISITSKEPSVKYRGIFLNDEWPSLGNWANGKFGGLNENFYNEVFELIIRLKGNYLWPAMWSTNFSEDGKSSKIANAALADTYGVVMGTSHHEPMFRAGVEWQRIYRNYGNNNKWDFASNGAAISMFWKDGLIRNKEFESIITMGMRGEADSALHGTDEQNIQLLKDIIITQKALLKEQNLQDAPQVLTLYKEVESFWYGTKTAQGLRNWDVLDDVIIMLSEDNFGNVRTLPTADEREREAGWGMYYHFDYHGGPRSYEWVNTTPITKVWEQMSMAYDYGVDKIWVVNVGDLKPMELPISYFLDLAYDFETWGTDGINKTDEYLRQWVLQQYGAAVDKDMVEGITEVLNDYTRMNGNRKPEINYPDTYSIVNFNEAQRVLDSAINLESRAKEYLDQMPDAYKDSYYQLVYYPAAASANVVKMNIYSGLNDYYFKSKSIFANGYASLVQDAINADTLMTSYYNRTMSSGKWNKMMSSNHIGYTNWDDSNWKYPAMKYIIPSEDAKMIVTVEGTEEAIANGIGELPEFTNLGKEAYSFTMSNGGSKRYDYKITTDEPWIVLDQTEGSVNTGEIIAVSVDWDKMTKSSEGLITISALGTEVQIKVVATIIDTTGLEPNTYVMTHNRIAIEAERFTANVAKSGVEWKVIDNYGKSLSSVKMFPTNVSFITAEEAPYLEYKIYVEEEGDYILFTYTAPSNNLSKESRLKFAVTIGDEEVPKIADTLNRGFEAGNNGNPHWNNDVMFNAHTTRTYHNLTKGTHTIRFYGIDAGVVLQRMVLSKGVVPLSFFGPKESYYVGKEVVQQEPIFYEGAITYTVPGVIDGTSIRESNQKYAASAVVAAKGSYKLILKGKATTDTVLNVMVGNVSISSIEWKAGETEVSPEKTGFFEQRSGKLTVDVKSGDVEITEIIFQKVK